MNSESLAHWIKDDDIPSGGQIIELGRRICKRAWSGGERVTGWYVCFHVHLLFEFIWNIQRYWWLLIQYECIQLPAILIGVCWNGNCPRDSHHDGPISYLLFWLVMAYDLWTYLFTASLCHSTCLDPAEPITAATIAVSKYVCTQNLWWANGVWELNTYM